MAFPDSDLQVQILAYLGADPTASSGSWPAPVDLSSRLIDSSMRITRGRNAGQSSLSSGSCTFDLLNLDGALTPLMPTSPYYGTWDLGVPVAVNVTGVGASPPYGRFRGYIADITQTFTPGVGDANLSVVRVTLGGKARQITQGKAVRSAMQRALVANPPLMQWPLEDTPNRGLSTAGGSLASGAASSTDGPAGTNGATRVAISVQPGAGIAAIANTSGWLPPAPTYVYDPAQTTTFTIHVRQSLSDLPSTAVNVTNVVSVDVESSGASNVAVTQLQFQWVGGTGVTTGITVRLVTADTVIHTLPAVTGRDIVDGQWHQLQIRISQTGADILRALYIDGSLGTGGTTSSITFGRVKGVSSFTVLGKDVGASTPSGDYGFDISNIVVHLSNTGGLLWDAARGYAGEQAHVRFARICTEDGLPFTSAATSSRVLGPQPVGDPVDILQDLEAADHGMLYELTGAWGFGYLAGVQRYNLSAALAIDLATYRTSGDSASVLTPVRNDAKVRNEWTVSTPDGRSATAIDTAHQAKHGRYNDSVTVNIYASSDPAKDATWRVHEGTFDGLRFRSMPIDLAANAASPSNLLTPWLALDLGARADRTNNPVPEFSYDSTTLILVGYTETIGRRSWMVDAVVEPYDPFRVGIWGNGTIANDDTPRWDGSHSTTSGSFNTASLPASLTVATSSGNLWTTTGGHFPLKCVVSGVVLTVSTISGSSSPQTFTITAASASKTIPSGSAVHIYRPVVYPLP